MSSVLSRQSVDGCGGRRSVGPEPARRGGCPTWKALVLPPFHGPHGRSGLCLATTLASLLAGCSSSTVQLVSYKDPYFPEKYHVSILHCAYRAEPSGAIRAVGRAVQDTKQGITTQYLCVHIFWQPKPGKTPADSTTTDALLEYVVATSSGVAVYTGTGFAYPQKALDGSLDIALESGRLRLQSHSGDLDDLFGNTQISGRLTARNDPGTAATLIREAELLASR